MFGTILAKHTEMFELQESQENKKLIMSLDTVLN